jgi:uncharacterized protein (DUF302 family)
LARRLARANAHFHKETAVITQTVPYGLSISLPLPYEDAVKRVRDELGKEGFGILTEIDVKATMKKKLDVDFRPYVILGACNPPLAHQALSQEPEIGLLLPCNVVVFDNGDGTSVVAAIDPIKQLSISGNDEIEPVAQEVRGRLERVLSALED